jgi:hypothetical protein
VRGLASGRATEDGFHPSEDDRCASSRHLLPDENHRLQENASRVRALTICPLWFSQHLKRRKRLQSRINLLLPADLLQEERDHDEKRTSHRPVAGLAFVAF